MTQLTLFQSSEPVPVETGIPGLRYVKGFLTPQGAQTLVARIDTMPWMDVLQRRVQHYGYRYDYKARRVTASMRLGPLPEFAQALAERLLQEGLIPEQVDQAIVNEYLPGQGISAHVDCVPCFGEAIVTISLGSQCEMVFANIETKESKSLLLLPRSVLILQGDSRYKWSHAIKPKLSDNGLSRARRISLTFRRVII